jgi:methyl-accepting chemotaxis protein
MRRTWTAALLVVALAGVAAGCGGSSDDETTADPTAAWASGFCSAVTTWTDDLQSITQQFTDTSNLSQDGLESAAEDARTSTQQLVDSLKDLGAPDTESGTEVKSALDSLSTTVETETAKIEETAQGVTGISSVPSAITQISASLSALTTAVSDTRQTIENADTKGELKTALEDSPDCADLSS